MVAMRTCSRCGGRFGPTAFEDPNVLVCRHCNLRDELLREVRAANRRIDALSSELMSLQEFVTLNVGVPPASTPAAAATASTSPPETQPTTATNDDPATEERAPPPQDEYRLVRNGARSKPRKILPVTVCQNRFQILADGEVEEEDEVRLVGDSMVRGQLTEFCGRAPRSRKRFCIPGGGVDDIVAAIDEVTMSAPTRTTYVIHVGSNDVQHTRSEDLMEKYRKMIQSFKVRTNQLIISGIVPRLGVERRFYNVATSTNRRLKQMCDEEGIGFVNTWDHFYHDEYLFSKDGVHLNQIGAARFGRVLNDAVKDFRTTQRHRGREA